MSKSDSFVPPLPERNQWCKKYPWDKLHTHGYFEYPIGKEKYQVVMRRITNAAIRKGLKITCRTNKDGGYIGVWLKDAA